MSLITDSFLQVQKESTSNQALHSPSSVQCTDPVSEEVCQLQRRENNKGKQRIFTRLLVPVVRLISHSVSYSCLFLSLLLLFFLGCWLSRISEHPPLHVSELGRSRHVRPLCCSGALWVQLSRWPLLLLCEGTVTWTSSRYNMLLRLELCVILPTVADLWWRLGVRVVLLWLLALSKTLPPSCFLFNRRAMDNGTRWMTRWCTQVTSKWSWTSRLMCFSTWGETLEWSRK